MKPKSKPMFFLLIVVILLAIPTWGLAASASRLKLSVPESTFEIGEEMTIEVWIEESPAMYGAETHLSFDPEILTVVDADSNQNGINVDPGSFLEQGAELQNQADNEVGTIDYAFTLLNPAESVEGSGLFFNVTFRAKANGSTTIQVDKSQWGTREATPIEHDIEEVKLQIGTEYGWLLIAIGSGITLLLVVMIIIVWRQLKRQQQAIA